MGNSETIEKLPKDHYTEYNGVKVHWFIGDINRLRFEKFGMKGAIWEAWGSCNGHAYQLGAWYDREKRELHNIRVLSDKKGYYFHEPTYKLLTDSK